MGGSYLSQGLSSLGQGVGGAIGGAIKDYQDTQAKLAGADLIINHAHALGQQDPNAPGAITTEDWLKAQGMGAKQKIAFSGGVASIFASDLARQQAKSEAAYKAALQQQTEAQTGQITAPTTVEGLTLPGTTVPSYAPGPSPFLQGTPFGGGIDASQTTPQADTSQQQLPIGLRPADQTPSLPDLGAQMMPGTTMVPGKTILGLRKGASFSPLPGQEAQYITGYGQVEVVRNPDDATKILGVKVNGQFHPTTESLASQLLTGMGLIGGKTGATGGGTVNVRDSTGKMGTIPADQLPAALKQGYTQVQ